MAVVAGVDSCRGGWAAIVLGSGAFADSLLAPSFARLLEGLADAAAIGVDIPIGVPESGAREADIAAREFVGPRRSSVFLTPPRPALEAESYAAARATLSSLSAQSFALGRKILEVEECLEDRVFEAHPEVSFAALAGRHLRYPKRSWNGHAERRRLLSGAGIVVPDDLRAGAAAADDVLDAAVVAWSAARKASGGGATLPEHPPLQEGRPVAIWY